MPRCFTTEIELAENLLRQSVLLRTIVDDLLVIQVDSRGVPTRHVDFTPFSISLFELDLYMVWIQIRRIYRMDAAC